MKKIWCMMLVLLISVVLFASENEAPVDLKDLNIEIGNIRIARPFIHAGTDFEKGIYFVTLTAKDGVPYFNFFNAKKELLFEEMGIVKVYGTPKMNKKPVIKKGFIKNLEYYRIKVKQSGVMFLGYLLVKKAEPKPAPEIKEVKEVTTETEKSDN